MIDASKGFIKDGNKNRLREQDIHKIVDAFTKQTEIDRYSRLVPMAEIAAKNDFNLNIPRYIDTSEPEDLQDIHAHLHGGIPERDIDALSNYWEAFPQLRSQLFKVNRPGYSDLTIDVDEVQQAILDSPEFQEFATAARDLTAEWFNAHRQSLEGIDADTRPNSLISEISDDLLARFRPVPLLDEYDVYEQLMAYWHAVMHDDVFLMMNEGWLAAAKPRLAIEDKDRTLSETPDLMFGSGRSATKYKTDLIPPALVVARYFASEQADLGGLAASAEDATRAVEEYVEEHATEDGLLAEAMDEGKISKTLVAARFKNAKREGSDPEEVMVLNHLLALYNNETDAKKAVRDTQAALDAAVLKKYGDLTEADIIALAVDDKWHGTISARVASEVVSLAQVLVARIRQLGDRYADTVSKLHADIETFELRVARHLSDLGIEP
jgi:type I restriction enzyme M protein